MPRRIDEQGNSRPFKHLAYSNNSFQSSLSEMGIISHDLKNPAIALRDSLQILVRNAHSWNADMLTDYYYELLHLSN